MYDIVIGRNEKDRLEYGKEGTIFLGKHYVKMGQTTSLSNEIYMDVTRSHVVFVCGKRGSGKCLTGDTLITLGNGLEIPISEIETNKENVFGLNNEFKVTEFEKTDFFKRQVNELLKVRLRSGREIKLTLEHPLLTVSGWKEVKNLTIGSRIATPRKIECHSEFKLSEYEIKILAYLIAEGHTKKPVLFSNSDNKIVEDLRDSLLQFHPSIELTELQKYCFKINSRKIKRGGLDYEINRGNKGRFTKGSSISHEKTKIRMFLENHGLYGLGALKKFVPTDILKLNNECLSLFLNRLFSCDGSIYKPIQNRRYWEISYSSSSEKLARQVQSLLLRFGILSKLRKKEIKYNDKILDSFELVLDGENVIRFIDKIGFFGDKQKKQVIALKEMEEIKRNTHIDTIPQEIWGSYKSKNWADIGKKLGYKVPKSLRSSISYSPSRQKLLQIAIADNNERLRLLAKSDVFWDEIISIEKLEGNFTVYDITVPEAHNFIANNIIVHNSYTMGVIAEGMSDLPEEIKNNLAVVMMDTMGIYWTMKYRNDKEAGLLNEWGLDGKELDVKIYTPAGYYQKYKDEGVPTDHPFSIKPSELDPSDWCMTFNIDVTSPEGVFIERMINDLKEKKEDYSVEDIVRTIKEDDRSKQETKDAVENRFIDSERWGIFSKEGTPLSDLVKGGQVTVLDVSCYATTPGTQGLRALVIGLVAEKLFVQRMIARKNEELKSIKETTHFMGSQAGVKQKEPLVWLVIDEAHEFLSNEGETVATHPLVVILREGRQPGISLILASQQPGRIHTDVMTQSDIVIAHRITAKVDIDALGQLMQSYMREGLDKQLNVLPRLKGSAIVFDDTNERMYSLRVRPRFTWHGGEAPTAMHKVKKVFDF